MYGPEEIRGFFLLLGLIPDLINTGPGKPRFTLSALFICNICLRWGHPLKGTVTREKYFSYYSTHFKKLQQQKLYEVHSTKIWLKFEL